MKPFVIAVATDAKLFPAAAFLASKLAALNPRSDTEIVIFTDSATDVARAETFGLPATLLNFASITDLPQVKQWPSAAFTRVLIPDLLGDEVRRILYIDTDTYPESDGLFRLFDIDMGEYAIAAVRAARSVLGDLDKSLNSGVLLIDRARYVGEGLGDAILKFAVDTKRDDQGAINGVLQRDWLELSPAMNMIGTLRFSFVPNVVAPSITHFAGGAKPWEGPRFAERHPARAEIEKFLLASPWRSFVSQNFGFQQAWDNLRAKQGLPTHSAPTSLQIFARPVGNQIDLIRSYLLSSDFADVKQGITHIDLSVLKRLRAPTPKKPTQ